jgi:hypothetical protein
MGAVQGPDKVDDTCMKTMHAVMMDRGFTVQELNQTHYKTLQLHSKIWLSS